jgi:prophage antirepressor-like protein
MNALIDLENCREHMIVTLGGRDHQVRLAGTIEDPYFCGRDVCDVLGYKDSKDALQRYVDKEDKIQLAEVIMVTNNHSLGGEQLPPQTMVISNHTLGKENFSYREGQTIFVSETGLYSLILSSQAPFAKEFKKLVCKTILPSIRKYGSFQAEMRLTETMAQLAISDQSYEEECEARREAEQERQQAEERLEEERLRAEELEERLEDERQLKEQTERETKEKLARYLKFNQATRQVEPQEYIYIATTDAYARESKFKPGGCSTFNLVKSRLSQYNSGKSDSDNHFFVYVKKVVNYRAIEQAILGCLGGFRENANKELYIINFDWLVKCVDAIIEHNTEFLAFVNLNRDQMVEDTMNKEPVIVVPLRLEKLKISYLRIGEDEVELTTILDQNIIDAIKDSLITFFPDNNIIKRVAFENHLKQHFPRVEINHKKRSVWNFVKKMGADINSSWKYKY